MATAPIDTHDSEIGGGNANVAEKRKRARYQKLIQGRHASVTGFLNRSKRGTEAMAEPTNKDRLKIKSDKKRWKPFFTFVGPFILLFLAIAICWAIYVEIESSNVKIMSFHVKIVSLTVL